MVNQLIIRVEEPRRTLSHGSAREQVHHQRSSQLLNLKNKSLNLTSLLPSLEKMVKSSKLSNQLPQLMTKEHLSTHSMKPLPLNMEFQETKLSSLENSKNLSLSMMESKTQRTLALGFLITFYRLYLS